MTITLYNDAAFTYFAENQEMLEIKLELIAGSDLEPEEIEFHTEEVYQNFRSKRPKDCLELEIPESTHNLLLMEFEDGFKFSAIIFGDSKNLLVEELKAVANRLSFKDIKHARKILATAEFLDNETIVYNC